MPDRKYSDAGLLDIDETQIADADEVLVLDKSDTTMAATGTNKIANIRTIKRVTSVCVRPSTYASSGSGTLADPYVGWDTATPWADNKAYEFGDDFYSLSATLALNYRNIKLLGEGGVIKWASGSANPMLTSTAGVAITADLMLYNNVISGLAFDGNDVATIGPDLEQWHNIKIEDVQIFGVVTIGMILRWCVCGEINNLAITDQGHYRAQAGITMPATGLILDNHRTMALNCTHIVFNNLKTQSCGIGMHLKTPLGCTFVAGTGELCTGFGLIVEVDATENAFINQNWEACNSGAGPDQNYCVKIAGNGTTLINCNTYLKGRIVAGAYMTMVRGGHWTEWQDDGVNSYFDVASLLPVGITGTGTGRTHRRHDVVFEQSIYSASPYDTPINIVNRFAGSACFYGASGAAAGTVLFGANVSDLSYHAATKQGDGLIITPTGKKWVGVDRAGTLIPLYFGQGTLSSLIVNGTGAYSLKIPNNIPVVARNAQNTADLPILSVSAANNITLGPSVFIDAFGNLSASSIRAAMPKSWTLQQDPGTPAAAATPAAANVLKTGISNAVLTPLGITATGSIQLSNSTGQYIQYTSAATANSEAGWKFPTTAPAAPIMNLQFNPITTAVSFSSADLTQQRVFVGWFSADPMAADITNSIHAMGFRHSVTTVGSVTLSNKGSGYTTPPAVAFTGGTFTTTTTGTAIMGINALALTAAGAGYQDGTYLNQPMIGGGGSGATFNFVVSAGAVQTTAQNAASMVVNQAGLDYTTTPTPDFSAALGTGATGTSTLRVERVDVTGGAGYTVNHTGMTFTGGGGSGAAGSTVLGGGWHAVVGNGTAQVSKDCRTPVTASTRYEHIVDARDPANIKFFINRNLVATHSANLPGATTSLMYVNCLRITATSARIWSISAMKVDQE